MGSRGGLHARISLDMYIVLLRRWSELRSDYEPAFEGSTV